MKSDYERQAAVEFYRQSRDQEADDARLEKLARATAQSPASAQRSEPQQPLGRRWRRHARILQALIHAPMSRKER
jgi:hypothetical protein